MANVINVVAPWQPIGSAPVQQTILVAYKNSYGNGRVVKAKFIPRFTEESSSECDCDEYDEPNDRYTYLEGWWEVIDNWDEFAFVAFDTTNSPTHWMPLPEFPT